MRRKFECWPGSPGYSQHSRFRSGRRCCRSSRHRWSSCKTLPDQFLKDKQSFRSSHTVYQSTELIRLGYIPLLDDNQVPAMNSKQVYYRYAFPRSLLGRRRGVAEEG